MKPLSLAARLFLLLLAGVLVAVFITAELALRERGRMVQDFREQATAERIADFLHLLAALPKEERIGTVRALPSGSWRIEPDDPPVGEELELSPSFTETLAAAAAPEVRVEAAWRIRSRSCGADCPGNRIVGAQVRFADGQRVRLERTNDRNPPYPPKPLAFAASLAILAGLLAAVVGFAVRLVLQPLRRMAAAAEAFGRDPEYPPMDESGPVEVRQAAKAFNRMRERLRQHIEERTRMLAAITHDLKTPLTRMRLRLEQCEDEALKVRLAEDIAAMQGLVAEGLALARSLEVAQPPEKLDLAALLQSLCDDVAEGGGDARFSGPTGALVFARPDTLRRSFLNLLDNAVKYGGGRVEVVLEPAGDDWLVRILDQGPGIPETQLAAVMQPFFRLETSRSRETGGTGLGLPIAANLLATEGGSLSLHNRKGQGLEARVRLPALRDRPKGWAARR